MLKHNLRGFVHPDRRGLVWQVRRAISHRQALPAGRQELPIPSLVADRFADPMVRYRSFDGYGAFNAPTEPFFAAAAYGTAFAHGWNVHRARPL
jgi:hypothetical protein